MKWSRFDQNPSQILLLELLKMESFYAFSFIHIYDLTMLTKIMMLLIICRPSLVPSEMIPWVPQPAVLLCNRSRNSDHFSNWSTMIKLGLLQMQLNWWRFFNHFCFSLEYLLQFIDGSLFCTSCLWIPKAKFTLLLQTYLVDSEFETVFGMTKEEFYEQPRWKQELQKKKADLFWDTAGYE